MNKKVQCIFCFFSILFFSLSCSEQASQNELNSAGDNQLNDFFDENNVVDDEEHCSNIFVNTS